MGAPKKLDPQDVKLEMAMIINFTWEVPGLLGSLSLVGHTWAYQKVHLSLRLEILQK